jgi:WD40 repeat protein
LVILLSLNRVVYSTFSYSIKPGQDHIHIPPQQRNYPKEEIIQERTLIPKFSRRTIISATAVAGAGVLSFWTISKIPQNPSSLLYYHDANDPVSAVTWSSRGDLIACLKVSNSSGRGSSTTSVDIWESSSGNLLVTHTGTLSYTSAIAWSPDGTRIASVGGSINSFNNNTVEVWAALAGSTDALYLRNLHPAVTLAWSPDGTRIASGGYDNTAQIWDAQSGAKISSYRRHSNPVTTLTWSPDSTHIASAGAPETTVQVWDAVSGTEIYRYKGHTSSVNAIAWSPRGNQIVSGAADGSV